MAKIMGRRGFLQGILLGAAALGFSGCKRRVGRGAMQRMTRVDASSPAKSASWEQRLIDSFKKAHSGSRNRVVSFTVKAKEGVPFIIFGAEDKSSEGFHSFLIITPGRGPGDFGHAVRYDMTRGLLYIPEGTVPNIFYHNGYPYGRFERGHSTERLNEALRDQKKWIEKEIAPHLRVDQEANFKKLMAFFEGK